MCGAELTGVSHFFVCGLSDSYSHRLGRVTPAVPSRIASLASWLGGPEAQGGPPAVPTLEEAHDGVRCIYVKEKKK